MAGYPGGPRPPGGYPGYTPDPVSIGTLSICRTSSGFMYFLGGLKSVCVPLLAFGNR